MSRRTSLLAVALFAIAAPPALAQSADEIIAASDRVRNPGQPFRVTDTLTEYVSGKATSKVVLTVYSKLDPASGQFRTVVKYVEPARDQGKALLKTGNVLWFFDPASKSSVRLSPQQRLLGQAANGDVVTVNLARDYKGTTKGEEMIQDADRKDRNCWHLDLKPSNDSATYGRIEYWIEKQTNHPIKGKFYSDSGRLLKIAYYRKFEEQLGGVRPTETVIIDAVDSRLVTRMNFSAYRYQDVPEAWFQREYLPRLGAE
jgi:outer membrane lipoprotein-sorting protein